MNEITEATRHLSVTTDRREDPSPILFQKALGLEFNALPAPVQSLHTVFDRRTWKGRARISRGTSILGNLLCRFIGFPPENDDTPVTVTIERRGDREIWQRHFGAKKFKSVLSLRDNEQAGHIRERFGPLQFDIDLRLHENRLHFPVSRGTLFGLPLPRWLLPVSEATETARDGRFHFDVKLSLPGLGLLVRYQGWLDAPATEI
ncbi:DUF4166 domain-containing protein [Roseibium sp.]|uniref:DUF4166 domain-containing protein n=1 Tax=Roseibium sp. TaxID=1936156 RepID=UPI0026247C07|nr:DUF4166 domain-containing protein [Roseibium sp.]